MSKHTMSMGRRMRRRNPNETQQSVNTDCCFRPRPNSCSSSHNMLPFLPRDNVKPSSMFLKNCIGTPGTSYQINNRHRGLTQQPNLISTLQTTSHRPKAQQWLLRLVISPFTIKSCPPYFDLALKTGTKLLVSTGDRLYAALRIWMQFHQQ